MKPSDAETDRKYVLRLRNVGVTYSGGVVALRSTTLDFFQREFSVLLGLSGAGKSTLLRSLNLLVKPPARLSHRISVSLARPAHSASTGAERHSFSSTIS